MEKKERKWLELTFTRHGQTHDNITGTLAGQAPGKLTDVGIKQAKLTGKYLRHAKFDYIYVSDLARTKDTFKAIAGETEFIKQMNPIYTADLREKHAGVLEGQPIKCWKEHADKEGKDIREYKCAKGQSWQDVHNRGYKFLHTLIRSHLGSSGELSKLTKEMGNLEVGKNKEVTAEGKTNPNCTRILAVSHGGYIMQFHNIVNFLSRGEKPVYNNNAKNCSIHVFRVEYGGDPEKQIDNKKIHIECVVNNDNSHITA